MKYIFLAGANGSGKSTLIKNLLSLDEYRGFTYVCADEFEKALQDVPDKMERMRAARDAAINYRSMLLTEGKDVIYESVASHEQHIEDLQTIHDLGYTIMTLYVATEDPKINIERIKNRGRDNDDYLTDERVIKRYQRSLDNVAAFIEKSDTVIAYDNSNNYVAVFTKAKTGENYLITYTKWAKKYIVEKLEKEGMKVLTVDDITEATYSDLLNQVNKLIK